MSLQTVVEDIREEAEARASEILSSADEDAADLISEAERDAERTIETATAEIEQQITREREQQLSSATLQAKQERLAARRDVLEMVYDDVAEAIAGISGERREELTRVLLASGLEEIDGNSILVYGRASDQELLTEVADEFENVSYAGEYDCLGGVVLESDTARIRVNNTFDSILAQVWEDELKGLSDRLFEQ